MQDLPYLAHVMLGPISYLTCGRHTNYPVAFAMYDLMKRSPDFLFNGFVPKKRYHHEMFERSIRIQTGAVLNRKTGGHWGQKGIAGRQAL